MPLSQGIPARCPTRRSMSKARRQGSTRRPPAVRTLLTRACRPCLPGRAGDVQGVPEMLLPHKKKRGKAGEKAKELTPQQKDENQFAASQRVYVEHGVRRCKAWRILRDEFRLGRGLFPLIAPVTVGLVHLGRLCPGH